MSYSDLPLSYCTNVHPGRTFSEVLEGLSTYTAPVAQECGAPVAAGLWLAAPVVRELLESPHEIPRLAEALQTAKLSCYTLNAFPYGDFHSARVKENVYLPDWTERSRLDYTGNCARILAELLPESVDGSISTMPLGFKQFAHPAGHRQACIAQLLEAAKQLGRIESETGRTIRLAIEPEPYCLLETTPEAVEFFDELFRQAQQSGQEHEARKFLGVCYDVCHQAVEFEDIAESFASLQRAGIRINKLHITCALELQNPGTNTAGREALAKFAEPRYLHQTLAKTRDGRILREVDLTPEFVNNPPAEFRDAAAWRIHFHVPVDAEQIGPLQTTRSELRQALKCVKALPYAPHLEVETYTWPVLPEDNPTNLNNPSPQGETVDRLIKGLSLELNSTQKIIASSSHNSQ